MRTTRIYYPGNITSGRTITLPANASHHLIRVLRYTKHMAVSVFDGRGEEYSAALRNENPKATQLDIQSRTDINRESCLKTILLQGISRGDHMDATIQKATELGVTEIIPVICERSTQINRARFDRKLERWRQIAISACEQCGRNFLPVIREISSFDEALGLAPGVTGLVLDPTANHGLNTIERREDKIHILCGPEGGLSALEIGDAEKAGYTRIKLGPRVLRTETAGPAFLSALQVLWGDMG